MLIDGIHVPLTSPFYRDGRSYLRKLEHNVARYSLTPVAGLVALASEGVELTDEEARESLVSIAEAAAKEKVLVATIERESVYASLRLAEEADTAGFDVLLVRVPRFAWPGDSAATLLHFKTIADNAALPLMLHSQTGRALPVSVLAELAAHPNVLGVYDDELTVERYREIAAAAAHVKREVTVTTVFAPVTRRMLRLESEAGAATFVSAELLTGGTAVAVAPPRPAIKTRTKTVGFQVMGAGRAQGMIALLEAGAAGAMPELAAVMPQGVYEALAAFKDGNPALAAEKQSRLEMPDSLIAELGVAGIKYGCDWNGYYGGVPRLPRVPLDAEARSRVEQALGSLRN
ncbi:dihydrodipicolinate synthase family protein [Granulicella sp. 5B5]|uniref:dihydrodipicolinate synthase family protein n=1 Tax=Granulicella sp. 5B5 TaxID=1617967 RepID=UPI0015F716E4|nr:dihydrodipicolinate synthase family protein [Granulicella sp. 5B5]QMV17382.1 dihydrodipicolinate synthase family protein [Granulicella sp. 5B5]